MLTACNYEAHRASPASVSYTSLSTSPTNSGRTSPAHKSCHSIRSDEGFFEDSAVLPNQPVDLWQCENLNFLWQKEFHRLFDNLLHSWNLLATFDDPRSLGFGHMKHFEDTAKVRFFCTDCLKAWTSMRGRVMFWYCFDYASGSGMVLFKLFGQKCSDCRSKFFEPAMWYPEEVSKVIHNLFVRLSTTFYQHRQLSAECYISTSRRKGNPRGRHDRELCHACLSGVCGRR